MDLAKFIQSLKVDIDKKHGPILVLDDWEHRDYIEDVLSEHFDIEYECMAEDKETGKNILYLGMKANLNLIEAVIDKINLHHSTEEETYRTK